VATSKPAGRVTLGVARKHNFGVPPVASPDAAVPAGVIRTGKGENAKRLRVYGYDNGAAKDGAGRVNKAATVVVVPGTSGLPKGVTQGQWDKLVAQGGKSVQVAYDAGVTSRTVRRSYRAGFIRFVA